jgi:hemerythrin-like metal-binding protein
MASSIPLGNQIAGTPEAPWNAKVQREEILDGRTRIVGYRFQVLPIDEAGIPPGPEMKLSALKADGLGSFAQQRMAIVPIGVDDWQMFDYRQFATRNLAFHLAMPPSGVDAAAFRHAVEDIRLSVARVALDWALIESDLGGLLELADIIFVRPSDYSTSKLGEVVANLRERYHGVSIAADGVASWDEYRTCLTMGIHYCLGGFTAIPYQEDDTVRQSVLDNVLDNKLVQFYWYRVFECGCEEIDSDHRALFALATDLLNAIISGRAAPRITEMVDALLAKAAEHFMQEEGVLARVGYARLEEHAAIHRHLTEKATRLVSEFKAGHTEIGTLFQFLAQDLIVNHMLGADRDFFPLFAQPSGAKHGKTAGASTHAKGAAASLPPPPGSAVGARLM